MEIIIGLIVVAVVGYVFYSKKFCCNKSMETSMAVKPAEMPVESMLASAAPAAKMLAKKAPVKKTEAAKATAKKVTKAPAAKKVAAKGKAASATKGKK